MEATDLPEPKPGHTELPWYIERNEKYGIVWIDSDYAPSSAIADLYQRIGDDLIPKENAEANAAYIITACNAYPAMLEALHAAGTALQAVADHEVAFGLGPEASRETANARKKVDAALSSPKET